VRHRLPFVTALVVILAAGLTSAASGPARAAFPGLNGKIAFVSNRDGNLEIYVMNADGGNQVNISQNAALDSQPSWSPDGNWLAFRSNRDGNSEIYKMRADGSDPTRLTNNSTEERYPAWTSDGRIVFERGPCFGVPGEIYIMNADGSGEQNITNNPAADCSPSGSSTAKIAFLTDRDNPGQAAGTEIYSMNPDGTGLLRLTNNAWCDLYPNWSPDGAQLVFVRDVTADCSGDNNLYFIQADGSGQVQLTDTPDRVEFFGAWSPQGYRIAFDGCPFPGPGDCQIYTINPDGFGEVQLTSTGSNTHPDWQALAPPPPPPPPPVVKCVVPRVIGLRLARAKAKIRGKHCSVGRIRRAHSRRVGRVIAQRPRPGTVKPRGFPVRLVVGRR